MLKLGNPTRINERCLELQKNNKHKASKLKVFRSFSSDKIQCIRFDVYYEIFLFTFFLFYSRDKTIFFSSMVFILHVMNCITCFIKSSLKPVQRHHNQAIYSFSFHNSVIFISVVHHVVQLHIANIINYVHYIDVFCNQNKRCFIIHDQYFSAITTNCPKFPVKHRTLLVSNH